MFIMTHAAAQEILAAARRGQDEDMALRIAARIDADGSVAYGMGFDDERVGDHALEFNGLNVLLGRHSVQLLERVQMDYVEIEPGRFDFVFAPQPPTQESQESQEAQGGLDGLDDPVNANR